MNRGFISCVSACGSEVTNTRPFPSASAICEKRSCPMNSPIETVAPSPEVSCAHPSATPRGTPGRSGNTRRLISGVNLTECFESAAIIASVSLPDPAAACTAASNGPCPSSSIRTPRPPSTDAAASPTCRNAPDRPEISPPREPSDGKCEAFRNMAHILSIQPDMKPIE